MNVKGIGLSGWKIAQFVERNAAKNNQRTFTTIKNGRYVVRTDLNNGTYTRTVINTDKKGNAISAYTDYVFRDAKKLKEKMLAFLSSKN